MALAATASDPQQSDGQKTIGDKLGDILDTRSSRELVILLAGPIGCGLDSVRSRLHAKLRGRGYEDVVDIKLSDFLKEAIRDKMVEEWSAEPGASERYVSYRRLQEAGKRLRQKTSNPALLAEYAIQRIVTDRKSRAKKDAGDKPIPSTIVPGRIAYVIDQVKRPEEVELLRKLYRNICFLIGVTKISVKRKDALLTEHVTEAEAIDLMNIDRSEDDVDGQQLDKTLHLADFFVRNDSSAVDEQSNKLDRLLRTIHGDKTVTPNDVERGMYAAYAAGLRSACLSRQVGAAIIQKDGQILSTGCNDVPRAGGGLYSESTAGTDFRCFNKEGQHCSNDIHKREMLNSIWRDFKGALRLVQTEENSKNSIELDEKDQKKVLDAIYKNSGIKDLIEFSRAVHAEMDAIVSLARTGGNGLVGATLYTTTFPCHSCARHIVAAGILKVYYIEPYEGSLAKDLHSDAIAFDTEETTPGSAEEGKFRRVEFLHFEGVAPRLYGNVFRAVKRKDERGKLIPIEVQSHTRSVAEYLDNYQDFERKAVEHLEAERAKLGTRD